MAWRSQHCSIGGRAEVVSMASPFVNQSFLDSAALRSEWPHVRRGGSRLINQMRSVLRYAGIDLIRPRVNSAFQIINISKTALLK